MNGLNRITMTQLFKQENFTRTIFPDVQTFVELAAQYLKIYRSPKMAMMRNSKYAFKNFKHLKYQWLWWNNGDIEAVKRNKQSNIENPVQTIARGIEAVTDLIKEDGF